VVGTEFEQWNSVQCVINSAKNKCVLLSAFTHEKFADEAAVRISESLPDGCEILLLSGEPDRINEPTFVERTTKYGEKLSKEGMPKRARIEATKRACHAKFVISDTGMVWIGSCNLLSAAPTSWVLESGLVIEDRGVASEIINHVIEEGWLSEESSNFISSMIDTTPQSSSPLVRNEVRTRVNKLVKSIKGGMKELGDGNINQNTLDRLLRLISTLLTLCERPQWSLVKTDQHRPAMLDLIRQSRKRIVIGSDAVRKRGLDLSTIREISSRPTDAENRASKFAVQIFWGRQDPDYVKKTDEEIEDARDRIKLLRNEVWKHDDRGTRGGLRSKFLPQRSTDPMLTHCKFISVDDERLLLTSDNLLSFSDDEGWDSDARELGILIDNPRIARLMRGEMELLTPTCRDFWQRGRWHTAVASAIEQCGSDGVPIGQVMGALIERIGRVQQLSDDWFKMKDNMKGTYKIPDSCVAYALVMEGAKDGLYEVNYPGKAPPKNLSHNNDKFKLITLSVPNMKASWEPRATN
jgi:phosphatidylserine/phosphatidylglycerophosphate/cardiolipin synthase-like enzyme